MPGELDVEPSSTFPDAQTHTIVPKAPSFQFVAKQACEDFRMTKIKTHLFNLLLWVKPL